MSDGRSDRRWPVLLCFVAALMLAIAPMPDWALPFRPDWVTLTLIYWVMILPHTYSVGSAWLIGLVLDVAQGTLLGQHALALSLVAYVTVKFHLHSIFKNVHLINLVYGCSICYKIFDCLYFFDSFDFERDSLTFSSGCESEYNSGFLRCSPMHP